MLVDFRVGMGSFHENVTLKIGQNEIVFDPLSILLIAAKGAKLKGPHGGLQVDKQNVCQVTGSMESPTGQFNLGISYYLHTLD